MNVSAAVLLLQLTGAPAGLGTVRVALEAADTATAVAQLQEMAMRPVPSIDTVTGATSTAQRAFFVRG